MIRSQSCKRGPRQKYLRASLSLSAAAVAVYCSGCTSSRIQTHYAKGEFTEANDVLARSIHGGGSIPENPSADSSIPKDSVRRTTQFVMSSLAAGVPERSEREARLVSEVYEARGINNDPNSAVTRRMIDALTTEGVARIWLGDAFEQMFAHYYIGIRAAMLAEWAGLEDRPGESPSSRWNDAASAALRSTFQQERFADHLNAESSTGLTPGGSAMSTSELYAWISADVANNVGSDPAAVTDDQINRRMKTVAEQTKAGENDSMFVPGHILRGISLLAIETLPGTTGSSSADANKAFEMALWADSENAARYSRPTGPHAREVIQALQHERWNVVLFVDSGSGPEKVTDRWIFAKYKPRTTTDSSKLRVDLRSSRNSGVFGWKKQGEWSWIFDTNEVANDYIWRGFDEVRTAKAAVGGGMVAAGAVLLGTAEKKDTNQQIAGYVTMGVGFLQLLFSRANTDHNELIPQRVYIVPLWLEPGQTHSLRLTLPGQDGQTSVMHLGPIQGPETTDERPFTVRYVRMLPQNHSVDWANNDQDMTYTGEFSKRIDSFSPIPGTPEHRRRVLADTTKYLELLFASRTRHGKSDFAAPPAPVTQEPE